MYLYYTEYKIKSIGFYKNNSDFAYILIIFHFENIAINGIFRNRLKSITIMAKTMENAVVSYSEKGCSFQKGISTGILNFIFNFWQVFYKIKKMINQGKWMTFFEKLSK